MSRNVIFCYSGTGNCLDMAKNIAKKLGDTDIIMMRKHPVKTDVTDAETVGFVVPCYGGGLPGGVEDFVREIKFSRLSYRYAIGQCAGYLGCGLDTINGIVPLHYWAQVTHQSSCIWLMPHELMMPVMNAEKAQRRSEKLTEKIAEDVLARRPSHCAPPRMEICRKENSLWPAIVLKKAKKLAVTDACIGCGQCARLCPRENIKLVNGRPQFGTDCIQCLGCLQYCPKEAITLGKVTAKREHYHNPNVSAEELMQEIIHID